MASAWKAASTVVLSCVSWDPQRRLTSLASPMPIAGMPTEPTVSHTPMKRIRVSWLYERRNSRDSRSAGRTARARYSE
jgi:hypothetical protein